MMICVLALIAFTFIICNAFPKRSSDFVDYDKNKDERIAICNKLTNCIVEHEVTSMVYERPEEVMRLIREDIEFVFGEDYMDRFIYPYYPAKKNDRLSRPMDSMFWAKVILLSKRGFIPCTEAECGFALTNFSKEDYEWNKKMLQVVERNLSAQGKPYKFYKSPNNMFSDNPVYQEIGGKFYIYEFFLDRSDARREW